jgi:hypothetical protein
MDVVLPQLGSLSLNPLTRRTLKMACSNSPM